VKRINILSFSRDALGRVREDVIRLARLEGLEAHARAVEVRVKCHDVTSPQSDQKRKGRG
jgi:histidinol dehydrogenase